MEEGLIPIANGSDFALYERPQCFDTEWHAFKLKINGSGREWWLSWNGQRFGRNRDANDLATHYPEVWRCASTAPGCLA
jgi:hypothetical protein